MISIRNLSKRFGDHKVLNGVSLQIEHGETVALLGPSGSGKTTLLRCIVGLERFNSGQIEVEDILLNPGELDAGHEQNLRSIRRSCGLVFQQYHLFPHMTVLQNVMLAPRHVGAADKPAAELHGLQLLEQVGLSHKATQRPSKLSGGEQQRVAIARALAMQPKCLLYDEPTSALDANRAHEIWEIMRSLAKKGFTQLIVTHQEQMAQALDCRTIRMADGQVVAT